MSEQYKPISLVDATDLQIRIIRRDLEREREMIKVAEINGAYEYCPGPRLFIITDETTIEPSPSGGVSSYTAKAECTQTGHDAVCKKCRFYRLGDPRETIVINSRKPL